MRERFPKWLAMVIVTGLLIARPAWGQDVPKGVEVMARGPIHEAFATPTTEPAPGMLILKQPPAALEEMPPEQKPDGDVVWVSGYWGWDDDRKDFLWVSGIWRTLPPGKQWVAGYWRQAGDQYQWVGGYWTNVVQASTEQEVTYLPQPPAPPVTAPVGEPPSPDTFYVPGSWVWTGDRYAWRSGYWAKVQPGYVWVPGHYRWTPSGYIYIAGYWDYAIAQRGVLFAPVVVDPAVVSVGFVYTPTFVVRDHIIVDSLFIRPSVGFYYFGDYYGPAYREWGFTSAVVYTRSGYDPLFTYARWEYRDQPSWFSVQLDISLGRSAGRIPCPPRTLVQQNTVVNNVTNVTNVTNINNTNINNTNINNTAVNNNTVLMPATQMAAAKNGAVKVVSVPPAARAEAKAQAQAVQQVATQRKQLEVAAPAGAPAKPRVSTLKVPQAQPAGKPASATATTSSQPAGHAATSTARPAASAAAGAVGKSTSPTVNSATSSLPSAGHGNPSIAHPATSASGATPSKSTSPATNPTAPTGTAGASNVSHTPTTAGLSNTSSSASPGTAAGSHSASPAGVHPTTTPSGTQTPGHTVTPTPVGRPPLNSPMNQPPRSGPNPLTKPPVHPSSEKKDSKQKSGNDR